MISIFNLEEAREFLQFWDQRKAAAIARMSESRFSEDGWFFGLAGIQTDFESQDILFGRIQRVYDPPGEVELASAIDNKSLYSVAGRYSKMVSHELFVRRENELSDRYFDLAWWYISLLRIKTNIDFLVPVAISRSWSVSSAYTDGSVNIRIIEDVPNARSFSSSELVTEEDIRWANNHFFTFLRLLKDTRLATANDALTTHHLQHSSRMSLALLWSAIEALFGIHSEIRFRLSAQIAALLEPRGETRYRLHNRIKKLYDFRSRVVHGSNIAEESIVGHITEVRALLSTIITKLIEIDDIPKSEEFEEMLFL